MILRTLAVLALAAPVLGQPPAEEPRQPDPDRPRIVPQERPVRAEVLRRELEARLAELQREQARVSEAVKQIDAGAAPERVADSIRDLREAWRRGAAQRLADGREDRPRRGEGPDGREGGPPDGLRGGPPGGPPGDGPRGEGPPVELTQEQRTQILAFAKEHMPELHTRFESVRLTDEAMANRILARLGPRLLETIKLKEEDPELGELRLRDIRNGAMLMHAMGALREARRQTPQDPAVVDAAAEEVSAKLAEQFDIRVDMFRLEITRLREQLANMEKEITTRLAGREGFIHDRLAEVIRGMEREESRPPGGRRGGP